MRMPSFRGWLEICFGGVSRTGGLATHATPVVEVDADLADLIPQYINNRWSDLRFARQLLANGDFPHLARMGRRLRASAISYGFSDLSAIAEALQGAADDEDGRGVADQLEAFERFLRSVRIEYI